MQKSHLKPKKLKTSILSSFPKPRLTKFEIAFNLLIILLFSIVYFSEENTEFVELSKNALVVIYSMYAIPFDLSPSITIYSRKIENILIQSLILFLIWKNESKFLVSGISIYVPIISFAYFNLMRFIGELYIGKDPIWIGSKYKGIYSDSKKRKNTSADENWTIVYFVLGFILCLFYANKRFFI